MLQLFGCVRLPHHIDLRLYWRYKCVCIVALPSNSTKVVGYRVCDVITKNNKPHAPCENIELSGSYLYYSDYINKL